MSDTFEVFAVDVTGGGQVGICRLPGLGGDIDADLSTIAAWAPAIVLSMTEVHEMTMAGCADIGERLTALGIAWAHIPIRDFGGPTNTSEASWPDVSAQLHAALDSGRSILIHCRGGQGRSGMMALRILVERGEDADAALARIRAVRPGAVETEAQRAWASSVTSADPSSSR